MWHQPVGCSLRLHLLGSLAEGQRLRLSEDVRQQNVVVAAQRVERLAERDEVARDEPCALMDELVERVLAVGAGLAPVDRAGVRADVGAVERDRLAVRLHGELLQVRREALEVLLVRQHRRSLSAEEVVVPDSQQAKDDRQVLLERSRAEVLVHLVEASEHRPEAVGADGQHRRQPDRRVHRITPTHPVPEAEHIGGVDAEFFHRLRVGRDRDKVLRNRRLIVLQPCKQPCASRIRIRHRLKRGEGLRRDDEQRLLRVEILHRFGEVGSIHVRHEPERQIALAVVLQRLVSHHRTKIRSTDPDIDQVANALAGMSLPLAAANPIAELRHGVEHGVNLGDDILAVYQDGLTFGRTQSDVQHSTVLRDVDPVAAEHGVEPVAQASLLRQIEEELQGLGGDTVLRVVEVKADGFKGQRFATAGVIREQLPKVQRADLLIVGLKGLPGRAFGELGAGGWFDASCHDSPLRLSRLEEADGL